MKTAKESKVISEVRAIRQRLQMAARRVGRKKYHEELNRRRGWFIGSSAPVVREKSAKYKTR
jgi:hypothetical protein